jgi:hypothetical protein
MKNFFILINILIHLIINPLFVSYSYSNNEIKYLKVKSFNSGKKPFDYNSLKKIIVPNTFPKYTISVEERCKTNENKSWKSSIIFYGDENFLWGVRDYSLFWKPENGLRIYMGTRKNDKILFKVIEAHEKWNNMLNWINGYSIDLKNKSIEYALKQKTEGRYRSSGRYRRQCELEIVGINKVNNTDNHLRLISLLERKQKKALEQMNKLGFRFIEKYDFENVQILTKELYDKEKDKLEEEKAKQEAEQKATKLAKEKAKREVEQKATKLAKEKAKREAEQKAKKLAKEKTEQKATKLAKEKAKQEAEQKATKLAEEKAKQEAKQEAEQKAKKLAEEKAKQEAEQKAKKLAEEKAKLIAQKKEEGIRNNLNWFRIKSEGMKRLLITDKHIFNFKNSQNNQLNDLYTKINEYLNLSNIEISNDQIIDLKGTFKAYNKLFAEIHKQNKKSGVYGKFNFQNIPIQARNNLERDLEQINKKLIQFIEILNSYFVTYIDLKEETNMDLENFIKSKFDENEYNYFIKILSKEKINELKKIDRNIQTYYKNFFWKASYHVSFGKKADLVIKEWLKTYQGNFVSYYNKKIYDLSVKENLKEIENNQKNEENFFNKIGN